MKVFTYGHEGTIFEHLSRHYLCHFSFHENEIEDRSDCGKEDDNLMRLLDESSTGDVIVVGSILDLKGSGSFEGLYDRLDLLDRKKVTVLSNLEQDYSFARYELILKGFMLQERWQNSQNGEL